MNHKFSQTTGRLYRLALCSCLLTLRVWRTLIVLLAGRRLGSAEKYLDNVAKYQAVAGAMATTGLIGSPTPNGQTLTRSRLLTEANTAYCLGDFDESTQALLKVSNFDRAASNALGMTEGSTRLIGSEILDSIGHCAAGLSMRAILGKAGMLPSHEYWLTRSVGPQEAYLRLWEQHFPCLGLSRETADQLEIEAWPLFESISTMRLKTGVVEQRIAHNLAVRHMMKELLPPLLSLPDEYELKARSYMMRAGFDPDQPFLCFHVRSSKIAGYGRDADIDTYELAMDAAIRNGYQVVRLGDPSMKPVTPRLGVWDYAISPEQHGFIDAFLMARCFLLVGTTSGPINVAFTFGTPILWTNAPDIMKAVRFPNCTMLPKLLLDQEGQVLPLRDLVDTRSGWVDGVLRDGEGKLLGPAVRWRDNSALEIETALEASIATLESHSPQTGVDWPNYVPLRAGLGPPPIDIAFWRQWKHVLD